MSQDSRQLENVFKEVISHFNNVSQITITPEEGCPPEQYTVTYHLPGVCKNEKGEVYLCDQHVITISLPFGFPHFPPNCRPKTPTFHPDFDSSAIFIGDAWQADQSITKLILHIGHMISGEIYSLNNAFNEEAAEWYQKHRDQLPFADQPGLSASPAKPASKEAEIKVAEIDALSDYDFSHSLSPEQEEESIVKESQPPLSAIIDIDHLRKIAKQKRFHTLSQELQTIDTPFNGREQLEIQAQESMERATALYYEADALENRGEHKKAFEKYQATSEVVSDFPHLQEAKKRIQNSLDLLGDWVTGEKLETKTEEKEASEDAEESVLKTPPSALSSAKTERTFYEEETRGSRWPLYALGGGSIVLLAALALSYFSLCSNLKEAQQKVTECRTLFEDNNFTGAEQKCVEAQDLISSVQLIKQSEKKVLAQEIQTLLTSEKLRQGLEGKILLDGQFVSGSTKELILSFKEAKNNGDILFQQEIWQEAILNYEKALEITTKTTAVDENLIVEIHKQLSRARFNSLMQAGEKSFSSSDWEGATKHFNQALELAKTDPNIPPEDMVQLELLSNQTKFNTLCNQGHAFFNNNEWLPALDSYERAQKLAVTLNLPESKTISALYENIARTKIYLTVENGRNAFAAAHWDEAITQYKHAITLLDENSKLFTQIYTEDTHGKLSRILLHASINRDDQDVAKLLKAESYEPALAKLQHIKKSITASPFATQPEFQTILIKISTQIETTETQLLIINKTAYLIDNFKKLFLKHYPASALSILSSPKVEYLKNRGNKLLFKMQCTEESGGRPIRLQMNYLYIPTNDQWEFSTDEDQ